MKKLLLTVGIASSILALCTAKELQINGNFAGSKPGDTSNKSWQINGSTKDNIGTCQIVAIDNNENLGINIKTTSIVTPLYTRKGFPISDGEKIEVKAKTAGTGKFRFLIYLYDNNDRYIDRLKGIIISVNRTKTERKQVFTIKNNGEKEVCFIRVVIVASVNSDITFSDIKAELKE